MFGKGKSAYSDTPEIGRIQDVQKITYLAVKNAQTNILSSIFRMVDISEAIFEW